MRARWLAPLLVLSLSSTLLAQQSRSRATPTRTQRDPLGIVKQLQSEIRGFAFENETVDTNLAIILGFPLFVQGFEIVKEKPMKIRTLENGTVEFKGRRLPAAILSLEVPIVNRAEGEYSSFCVTHAAALDREFKAWRGSYYWACGKENEADAESSSTLQGWKTSVTYRSE